MKNKHPLLKKTSGWMFSHRSSRAQICDGGRVGKLREHVIADRKMIADTRFASGLGEFLLRGTATIRIDYVLPFRFPAVRTAA